MPATHRHDGFRAPSERRGGKNHASHTRSHCREPPGGCRGTPVRGIIFPPVIVSTQLFSCRSGHIHGPGSTAARPAGSVVDCPPCEPGGDRLVRLKSHTQHLRRRGGGQWPSTVVVIPRNPPLSPPVAGRVPGWRPEAETRELLGGMCASRSAPYASPSPSDSASQPPSSLALRCFCSLGGTQGRGRGLVLREISGGPSQVITRDESIAAHAHVMTSPLHPVLLRKHVTSPGGHVLPARPPARCEGGCITSRLEAVNQEPLRDQGGKTFPGPWRKA